MTPTLLTLSATATLAATGIGIATHAAMWPTSQLYGPILIAGPNPNQIALTFDDGPNPTITPHLLEVLARHNIRATFFLIGNYVRQQPALTRQIAAAGHLIGSHTMSHPRLPLLTRKRIREEIADSQIVIEQTIGAPIRFFRPPYGQRRPAVLRIARELGMTTVQWNVMVGDWKPIPAGEILTRMQTKIARNRQRNIASNIVLHDGGQAAIDQPRTPTVEATERLIQLYPEAEYVTPEAWTGQPILSS